MDRLIADTGSAALPPLREDLVLHPDAPFPDGSSSWVIHDPPRGRFFQIGWPEFEILHRWRLGSAEGITAAVNRETPLNVSMQQVENLRHFLHSNQLLRLTGEQGVAFLDELRDKTKAGLSRRLLHSYLFFRLPLFRPDRLLQRLLPAVRFAFQPAFLPLLVMAILLGFYLVSRQWDSFLASFPHFYNLQGLVIFALALIGAKAVHELGHAFTARHYGLRVPSMGVAFIVLWPVLYTDTSEAWKVGRRQRFIIGASGMIAELLVAALATLAWSLLPDGPLRSAMFMLATTTWVMTLLINLNPLMRFDGYYLLSDYLGVKNLQERSFQLARWRLRNLLFGLQLPCPETLRPRLRRTLILFAWTTWLYRFFLFLAIALLVYHFFFKLLGIFLMAVELAWFVVLPIYRELLAWKQQARDMTLNRNSAVTLIGLLALLALVLVPWQQTLHAPALARYAQKVSLFPAEPGELQLIAIADRRVVEQGQPLYRVDSLPLRQQIENARAELEISQRHFEQLQLNPLALEDRLVAAQRVAEASTTLQGLQQQAGALLTRAGFTGMLVNPATGLHDGIHVGKTTRIADLVATDRILIEAYFEESQLSRILDRQSPARFYPRDLDQPPVPVRLHELDTHNTTHLQQPALASVNNGDIAVVEGPKGELIPEHPVYRAIFVPADDTPRQLPRTLVGSVHLEGERSSLLTRVWNRIVVVFLRESGF